MSCLHSFLFCNIFFFLFPHYTLKLSMETSWSDLDLLLVHLLEAIMLHERWQRSTSQKTHITYGPRLVPIVNGHVSLKKISFFIFKIRQLVQYTFHWACLMSKQGAGKVFTQQDVPTGDRCPSSQLEGRNSSFLPPPPPQIKSSLWPYTSSHTPPVQTTCLQLVST